jgi:hypothetical protein
MEESFYRNHELRREQRFVPASIYNLARTLLSHEGGKSLFVPIRSMQYLAVIDQEEIIFVHREGRRMIDIAWQNFQPQVRTALEEPVAYEAVYYNERGPETMKRLQGEFQKALQILASRHSFCGDAKILDFARRKEGR